METLSNPDRALIGFLLSLTPLSMDLMGWRGAGGNGAAGTATYFFFGGLLMILGALGEVCPPLLSVITDTWMPISADTTTQWIIGNTFPFVVFGSFGAFWLGFAGTLQPFYNAYGAYSTTDNPADGLNTVGFRSSFGK